MMKVNNNRKNIKRFLILLSLIASIISMYEIANIYAVFYSQTSGTLSEDIAKWRIVVNGTNIVSETIRNFEINKLNIENANATNGKLTPGMVGSFNIEIDPQDTQVSIRYDILIDDCNIINTDIRLISVEEIVVGNTIIKTDENTYTGIIPLSSIKDGYINNVKMIFKWEENQSNPTGDVEVGEMENPAVQVPISVKVSQYLGEEIIAYTD